MHLLHHLLFKNLDHYLAIGTFIHNWYEDKKAREQKLGGKGPRRKEAKPSRRAFAGGTPQVA